MSWAPSFRVPMTLVTVTALRDFWYEAAGKEILACAVIQMPPIDAAIHIYQQNVSGEKHPGLSTASLTPDPEPEPEPAVIEPPKPKRRYRRRDLVADKS